DAQSAFDQVISFAGKEIKDDDVGSALGIIGPQTLNAFVEAIADRDVRGVLSLVDQLVSRGYDLRNFAKEMMAHFRNLLVIRAVGFDRELVAASESEAAEMHRLSGFFSEEDLIRFFNVLTKVEQDIKNSTQERFQLELGLLKLTQMARLASLEELLERIKRLEGSMSGGSQSGPPARTASPSPSSRIPTPQPRSIKTEPAPLPSSRPVQVSRPEPPPEPPPVDDVYETVAETPSSQIGGSEIDRIRAILEGRKKMRVLMAFDSADSAAIEGDTLKILFPPKAKVFAEQLGSRDTTKLLEEIASEVTGRKITVAISGSGGEAITESKPRVNGVTDPATTGKSPRQRATENPIVQSF